MMEWEGSRKHWYARINKDTCWVTLLKVETEKVYSPSMKHPKICRVRGLILIHKALENSSCAPLRKRRDVVMCADISYQ